MFGRFPKQPSFAPGPYATTVQIPRDMGALPFIFVRAHAWPKQDLASFYNAVNSPRAEGVPRGSFFLNAEGMKHPYRNALPAVSAVRQAQERLARMQQVVLQKLALGFPLNYTEARELFAMRYTPTSPKYINNLDTERARARADGRPVLRARQISAYPASGIAPAVARMRAALSNPYTCIIDERTIVSQHQRACDLMSAKMKRVVGSTVLTQHYDR